jgi:hypothetical protein
MDICEAYIASLSSGTFANTVHHRVQEKKEKKGNGRSKKVLI